MNKTVFISGATSGIGKACAVIFAKNGYNLIINGRRKEKLEEIKTSLEASYKVKIHCVPFDVSNREAVFKKIESLPAAWQEIDILINNAGLALGRELVDDAIMSDWETMIDTNINGLLYVSKAILPFMIKNNKGHIINMGSIAGDQAYERGNVYCATKSAVDTISKAMRIDLLPHRIKVTNIKPGAVETEFALVRFKGDEEKASKTYQGFTPLSPEDIANTIFYCASLPDNVCINELSITCLSQANGVYTFKD
ncbi:MAG: SDR family NAD(P)-dependent oxidoreductase [Ginsengibacter sp.]